MNSVLPRLYASEPESLPFGPSLEIRAFLIERDQGNLLIYRADTLEPEIEAVNDLGGIARQYLNHRHEASPACDWVAETFGAPLYCHAEEAPSVSETCNVAGTFSGRYMLDDDFEIIPTPGHTSGATTFLWDSGQQRVLFTGDTLYFPNGAWSAALLDDVSDREQYIASLELIRSLNFDVLVPSIARSGQPYCDMVQRADTERQIDAVLERLRHGENH